MSIVGRSREESNSTGNRVRKTAVCGTKLELGAAGEAGRKEREREREEIEAKVIIQVTCENNS